MFIKIKKYKNSYNILNVEKKMSWNIKRFIITQLPNVAFFIVFIFCIIFTWFADWIPWFLLPDSYVTNFWRLIELSIGYVFTIITVMFVTWGTVSLTLDTAMGKEIGKKDEKAVPVSKGAYSYCRHPITFGFFFATPGAFLIFDFVPLLLTTIIYTPMLFLFLIYEEKELKERYGEAYLKYKQKTSYLIPKKGKKNGIKESV
jgi:protein-S-isoprenylcysteine O-methyltransferase Ste14